MDDIHQFNRARSLKNLSDLRITRRRSLLQATYRLEQRGFFPIDYLEQENALADFNAIIRHWANPKKHPPAEWYISASTAKYTFDADSVTTTTADFINWTPVDMRRERE